MTTATGLGPLPEMLEERESRKAVRRLFAEQGVPLQLVHDRQHRLPLATMAALFDGAARRAGDAGFGLDVGARMPPGDYGLWVRYAMQAPTLADAIMRIGQTLHLHQSGTLMRIAPRAGGRIAWEYRHAGAAVPAFAQHVDHVVPVMLRIMRAYAGPGWMPRAVEVAYPAPRDRGRAEDATGAPWVFGQPSQAIVMDAADLDAPRRPGEDGAPQAPLVSLAEVVAASAAEAGDDPIADIAATVALRLLDGRSDIEGAAAMLGASLRTVQRRLEDEGLTYRALMTRTRMRRARSLVAETDQPLKRIGLELGYADPAHFTRAFSRYFGVPPSRLRVR